MSFFAPTYLPPQLGVAEPADYDHADSLRRVVVRTPGRVRRWRRSRWADEFRLLRLELQAGGATARDAVSCVSAVLRWYDSAAGMSGVPAVSCGESFRRHYDWLRRLSATVVPAASYSDRDRAVAASLLARLRGRDWGVGTGNLETSVRESVHHLHLVLDALSPLKTDARLGGFATWVWPRLAGETFLINWYEAAWGRVRRWDGWAGSFAALTFSARGTAFKSTLDGFGSEYGDARAGTAVLLALGIDTVGGAV